MKVKIAWNGTGGELVSYVIEVSNSNDIAIQKELIRLLEVDDRTNIGLLRIGDSITITEVEE
jgi:hypothetical protein